MEEREDESRGRRHRVKKAKSFGLSVVTFIFGILFLLSIGLCVLFATGVIAIEQSEDGKWFVLTSPLTKNEADLTPAEPGLGVPQEVDPDNGGSKEESEESATTEDGENETFAGYNFKINEVVALAKSYFTESNVYVDDLRATTEGDYLVVRLYITNGNYSDAKYFYRPVDKDGEWTMIRAMGSQAAPLCSEMSDLERRVIREAFPEKKSCFDENNNISEM